MIGYGRIFQFTKESWVKTQKRVFTAHILSCLLLQKRQSRPSRRWTYPEPSVVTWQKMILGCIEMYWDVQEIRGVPKKLRKRPRTTLPLKKLCCSSVLRFWRQVGSCAGASSWWDPWESQAEELRVRREVHSVGFGYLWRMGCINAVSLH